MASNIEKNSARLMLSKLQSRLDGLYDEQESQKMCKGGRVKRKMQPGGPVLNLNPADNMSGVDLWGFQPNALTPRGFDPSTGLLSVPPIEANLEYPTPPAASAPTGGGFLSGVNWGDVGGSALTAVGELLPGLFNLGKYWEGPKQLTEAEYQNPYEAQALSVMRNRRFNVDPLLYSNRGAYQAGVRNLRNVGGGRFKSNQAALLGSKAMADAQAYAQKQSVDNAYAGEFAQMLMGAGSDRANRALQIKDMNLQHEGRRNEFLGQFTKTISDYTQRNRLMNAKKERDAMLASIYPDMFGGIYGFMPGVQNLINTFNKTSYGG